MTRWDCLFKPDPHNFLRDVDAMIVCMTWQSWRESFMMGLERAVLGVLLIAALVIVTAVARRSQGDSL